MLQKFGLGELALLLIIAFLVFGPSKLPQLGKSIGEGIKEFKNAFRSVSGDETKTEGKSNDQ
ncbi:MAG TPA: twin-arginine translocase TatA/TatE family subunit [Symbiobacteriaceae bacterium]|nr:twin-arginine translocase TatA/TatE family subunit [Symbiobacteriaceae bacterium]